MKITRVQKMDGKPNTFICLYTNASSDANTVRVTLVDGKVDHGFINTPWKVQGLDLTLNAPMVAKIEAAIEAEKVAA